ncbi:PilN domain-containing protein [Hydrogenophaga sp. OTU3427]|uniref:PilN domain-containing protein n=1 Tax=Hydrogenophaga sp. OTU3427 TaxID=3043856 RepID=UPI00313BF63C
MILINLLPHREEARKRRRELFLVQVGLAALAGGLVVGLIFTWFQNQITSQQSRNRFLSTEIAKLDAQIKDIAGLQAQLAALKARQLAVEDLQADRNLPVHLLDEMVKQMPEGVFLSTLKQENQTIVLTGVAQSQERVSELLRNLNNSRWVTKPELVEIVAANLALSPREQRRVSNFSIRVALTRSTPDPKAIPAGAAKPAPAGKS